jgi:hypothetical protein
VASTYSTIVSTIAPALDGVWIHDPTNPVGTLRGFLFGSRDRTQEDTVTSSSLQFVGRTYPVYEYGDGQGGTVQMTIQIPFGDTWAADVAYLRALPFGRTTYCYRDNRGRVLFGSVVQMSIADQMYGTAASLTVNTVDFTESVA